MYNNLELEKRADNYYFVYGPNRVLIGAGDLDKCLQIMKGYIA